MKNHRLILIAIAALTLGACASQSGSSYERSQTRGEQSVRLGVVESVRNGSENVWCTPGAGHDSGREFGDVDIRAESGRTQSGVLQFVGCLPVRRHECGENASYGLYDIPVWNSLLAQDVHAAGPPEQQWWNLELVFRGHHVRGLLHRGLDGRNPV